MLKLESWYIRPADNLVVGIHVARGAMCLRVFDLNVKEHVKEGEHDDQSRFGEGSR